MKIVAPRIVSSLLLLVIGAVFIVTAWHGFTEYIVRKDYVGRSMGRITNKYIAEADSGKHSTYQVNYIFSMPTGKEISGNHELLKHQWDNTKINDFVEICYDPSSPEKNFPSVEAGSSIVFAFFLFLVGAVFEIFGIMRMIYIFKN